MPQATHRFALIGAAGFVAPRHMRAIKDAGATLAAAVDPHDSVGVLDSYFPSARFFTEFERFDRHLEKLRRTSPAERVNWVSVCSPNYLHDAHVRLALRIRANVICEKPLVINPWNLDQLAELEAEFGQRVFTILQLRLHPALLSLKAELERKPPQSKADVVLTYVTRRGSWYDTSWKGDASKSGGLSVNLGVHFFDALQWLFGATEQSTVHLSQPRRMAGALELERARVRWFLSVETDDLPDEARAAESTAWRSLTIDGRQVEFSGGFTDLHTRAYEQILSGHGPGVAESRPSIELVHRIRTADVDPTPGGRHPYLAGDA